jgi:hypothetical protein
MANVLKQKITYVYLSLSIVSVVVALIIGIDDNPPGIVLCFIGSILFILAFTYSWKKAKPFRLLIVFSLVGFVISLVLYNVLEATNGEGTLLGIIGVVFFLIAIFICPAGFLVGIGGSIVKSFKKVETIKN